MTQRIRKSATLRRMAHQLLNTEERAILKHVIRIYRHSNSLDTLCSSLAKIINSREKVELITAISAMFPSDLEKDFLRRCQDSIPSFALTQKHTNCCRETLPMWCRPMNGHRYNKSSSYLDASSAAKSKTFNGSDLPNRPVKRLVKSQTMPEIDTHDSSCNSKAAAYGSSATISGSSYSLSASYKSYNKPALSQQAKARPALTTSTKSVESLADRISNQLTRRRPSLATLADKGFWRGSEDIPECDEEDSEEKCLLMPTELGNKITNSFHNKCSRLQAEPSFEEYEILSTSSSDTGGQPNLQALQVISPAGNSGQYFSKSESSSSCVLLNNNGNCTPDSVFGADSPDFKTPLIFLNGVKQFSSHLIQPVKSASTNKTQSEQQTNSACASSSQEASQYPKNRRELHFLDMVQNSTEVCCLDILEKNIKSPQIPPSPMNPRRGATTRPLFLRQNSSSPMRLSVPLPSSGNSFNNEVDQNLAPHRTNTSHCSETSSIPHSRTFACTQTLSSAGKSTQRSVLHSQVSVNFDVTMYNPVTVSLATQCVQSTSDFSTPPTLTVTTSSRPLVHTTVSQGEIVTSGTPHELIKDMTTSRIPSCHPHVATKVSAEKVTRRGGVMRKCMEDVATSMTPSVIRRNTTRTIGVETNGVKLNSSVQTDSETTFILE